MARASATALLLAARKLAGPAVEQVVDVHLRRRFPHRALDLRLGVPTMRNGKAMFSADSHVRIERVALEHHGDVALARFGVGDIDAVEQHAAGVDRLEAGEDAQRRRLARARGPSSAKNSPGAISRSMPCSAVNVPWRLTMPSRRTLTCALLTAARRP